MRNRLLIITAATAAVTGICGPAAVSAVSAENRDTASVQAAHQGNLGEIAAGQDAQKHATTSCVKSVGATLVTDHQKLDMDLQTLATKYEITLPDVPVPEQQQKLKTLREKAGTAGYDTAWLANQEATHTKALAMIDTQIRTGGETAVTNTAKKARPVIARHLALVRGGTCHTL